MSPADPSRAQRYMEIALEEAAEAALRGEVPVGAVVVDGETDIAGMGERIFELILKTASGQASKSEALGFGDEEFVPWQIGAVM